MTHALRVGGKGSANAAEQRHRIIANEIELFPETENGAPRVNSGPRFSCESRSRESTQSIEASIRLSNGDSPVLGPGIDSEKNERILMDASRSFNPDVG